MATKAEPVSCLATKITTKTIWLRGKPISLRKIARKQGIDDGYLSRTLSGVRDPLCMSIRQAMGIASALGMGLEDFIDAVEERREKMARERAIIRIQHEQRLAREAYEDKSRIERGLPPIPRIPLEVTPAQEL